MWIPNQEGTNCLPSEESPLPVILQTSLAWGQRDWDSRFKFF